jgi:hypothetical protein
LPVYGRTHLDLDYRRLWAGYFPMSLDAYSPGFRQVVIEAQFSYAAAHPATS